MLHVTKIATVGQSSGFGIEEQHADKTLAQRTPDSTLAVKETEANVISGGIGRNQLQGNNQTNLTTGSANTTPEVCLSLWVQDVMTLKEAVRCVVDDAKRASSSQ